MKVNIGKYPSTKSKKPRKVEIKIDDWDTWDAGRNLALIAVPLLEKLKEDKQGSPFVDDEDVPEELRSYNSKVNTDDPYDPCDENFHNRWKWVLDEITYALTEVANEFPGENKFFDHSEVDENSSIQKQISAMKIDREGLDQYNQRVKNGCRLFGVYFMSLWS